MDVDEEDDLNSREDEGFVLIANELLDKCNIKGNVSSLTECSDAFFLAVYQGLLGDDLKDTMKNPITCTDRVKNCQSIIDTLASEVLDVDLCHITGESVVSGDRSSIRNLLEIFAGLLEYFLECAEGNADERSTKDEEDDSNILTSEHDIISGVLREELGPSYSYPCSTQADRSSHAQSRRDAAPIREREAGRELHSSYPHVYPAGTMAERDSQSRVDGMGAETREEMRRETRGEMRIRENRGEMRRETREEEFHPSYPHVYSSGTLGERDSRSRVDGMGGEMREEKEFHSSSLSRSAVCSTGPETDTSKVSDSTAELIRLGETSTGSSSSSKAMQGRDISDTLVPDTDLSSSLLTRLPSDISKTSGVDVQGHLVTTNLETSQDLSRARASAATRSTDVDPADLTQYTLESSTIKVVPSSFLSMSSSSASWSEQISPLDPERDGSNGASGFESLGVRPRTQPRGGRGADKGDSEGGSGRSTPMVHHYHHHFHHGPQAVPVPSVASDSSSRNLRQQVAAASAVELAPGLCSTSAVSSAASQDHRGVASTTTSSSYRPSLELSSSVGQRTFDVRQPQWSDRAVPFRTSALGPSYEVKERSQDWRMGSEERGDIDSEPPHVRRETAADLLTKYTTGEPSRERRETAADLMTKYTTGEPSRERRETAADLMTKYKTAEPSKERRHTDAELLTKYKTGEPSRERRETAAELLTKSKTGEPSRERRETAADLMTKYKTGEPSRERRETAADLMTKYKTAEPSRETRETAADLMTKSKTGEPSRERRETAADLMTKSKTGEPSRERRETAADLMTKYKTGEPSRERRETAADLMTKYKTEEPSRERRETAADLMTKYKTGEPSRERRETAAELLTKSKTGEPSTDRTEGEVDEEEEDLAQLSDSIVDYSTERDAMDEDRQTALATNRSSQLRDKRGLKTSSRRPQRVTFKDDVETIPVTSRMDRLRRLLNEEERDQGKQQADSMRTVYREQLRDLQREEKKVRQPKRKVSGSPIVRRAKKKIKAPAPFKQRGRLEAVYRSQSRRPRKQTPSVKGMRKRSASASPVMNHRQTSPDRSAAEEALLPAMFEEFPFLHVSPQTAHNMWTKQARQLSALMKSDSQTKRTKTQKMLKEAERRQGALVGILNKELEHSHRMREQQERLDQERSIKNKLREKRHISARARRYYDDYQLRMRSKMLKRRTREEQIFKKVFEDGLDIQKERIRELRQYAKEKREAHAQRQQNEIQSMENYYRDQFSMLAESIARERCDIEVRENAQEKVMRQMRSELRHKMETEIQEFQEILTRDEDSAYFRQLEADRLRREFQLAAYKTHF